MVRLDGDEHCGVFTDPSQNGVAHVETVGRGGRGGDAPQVTGTASKWSQGDAHDTAPGSRVAEKRWPWRMAHPSRFKRIGIRVSPATCGRILALNRALYTLPKPKHSPSEKQAMPFASVKRHEYWPVDVRRCARMLYHLCKRLVQEGTY